MLYMKDQGGATLFKCSACKSDYHHLCAVTGTGGGGNREELGKVTECCNCADGKVLAPLPPRKRGGAAAARGAQEDRATESQQATNPKRPLCPLTKLTGTNKRDVLLCPRYGLTCVNLGTNAYIAGLLAMYKVPVTCLQTIKQPVSHRAAGLLRNLFHGLKRDFIGTPQVPPQLPKVFAEYIELLEDGGAANQPQLNFSEEAEGE